MVPVAADETTRERAIRLFTFLREVTELRTKTIRTLDQYDQVLWFHDIPREPGCFCIARQEPHEDQREDVWVEIKKPKLKPPPLVPAELRPWLDPVEVEDSSLEYPELRDRIVLREAEIVDQDGSVRTEAVYKNLEESPEIADLWVRYVEKEWEPWAKEDRRLGAVQKFYADLFSLYQRQQRLGETYEVVLGIGYLTWRTPAGHLIKRHIITCKTSLTFYPSRGVIVVGPAGDGPQPGLEQDMLEPQERPDVVEQNTIGQQVKDIGDSVWDGVQIQTALKSWIHAVSARGTFEETLTPQTDVGDDPRIHFAPALILRKRTERNMLRVLQDITAKLELGEQIPLGVKRLVTILDDTSPESGGRDATHADVGFLEEPGDIYFPLPTNDEQLEIAKKLKMRQGILVQGPPGTGKSHTIANLICHLLASGGRVLVTSHTARALKVLREKLPDQISDLCVLLLGDDIDALRGLEDSVQGITERYNNWDSKRNRKRIEKLAKELDEERRAEAETMNQLRAIREAETFRHPRLLGSYEGTLQSIARRLREEEERYSWLPVQPQEALDPPLDDDEATELVGLLREISERDEEDLKKTRIGLDDLVSPQDFVSLMEKEKKTKLKHESTELLRKHPSYEALRRSTVEQRNALITGLSTFLTSLDSLKNRPHPWVQKATHHMLTNQENPWRELQNISRRHLEAIGDQVERVSEMKISGLARRDRVVVHADAKALLEHLEAGGGLGIGPLRPKVVRQGLYLVTNVRVNGRCCDTPQRLRELLQWLQVSDRISSLRRNWEQHVEPPLGPLHVQAAAFIDYCEDLEQALSLHEQLEGLKSLIAGMEGVSEPAWHNPDDLKTLRSLAQAVTLEEEFFMSQSVFRDLQSQLRPIAVQPDVHPEVTLMLDSVIARDAKNYGESYKALANLEQKAKKIQRRDQLHLRLELATPELASRLMLDGSDPVWDGRMAEFTAAWNWGCMNGWLDRMTDPKEQERLTNVLDLSRGRIRNIMSELSSAKAWEHCFSRMTEHERQHLMAWTKAVRRIGKGTGKYASMHRRAAREHMEECRSTIPA